MDTSNKDLTFDCITFWEISSKAILATQYYLFPEIYNFYPSLFIRVFLYILCTFIYITLL